MSSTNWSGLSPSSSHLGHQLENLKRTVERAFMMDLKRCMTLDLLLFFTFEVLRLMSTGIAVVVYVVFYAFKKVRRDQLNGFAHKSTFERQDCQSLEAVEKSLSDAVQGLKVIYGHYSEVKYIERWLKYEEGASVPWLRQRRHPKILCVMSTSI